MHATRDGSVVVCHDPTVDRTTEGRGAVARMTLSEIRKLDAGYRWTSDGQLHPWRGQGIRIPTLLELIERFPDTPLNIEIKQAEPPIVEDVVRLLQEHDGEATGQSRGREPGGHERRAGVGVARGDRLLAEDALAFMDALSNGTLAGLLPARRRAPGARALARGRGGDGGLRHAAPMAGTWRCTSGR